MSGFEQRRRVRGVVALVLAMASVLAVVDFHSTVSAGDGLAPLAFGAFPQPEGSQSPQQAVTALESQIGRTLETVRVFDTWSDQFPDSYDNFLKSGGRTLILSIKPNRSNGTRVTWPQIATAAPGSQVDTEIRSWARRIRDFQAPIYVTLHHEPESTSANAYGTQADFIAAWRHWVDVFREEGATNVKFMWIMTDYSYQVAQTDRRYAPKWFPGDAWVDGMAIDAYNWHVCRPNQDNAWKTLATIIEPFRQFGLLHPTVDLWLTEWASWEDPAVANHKSQWIDQARALFKGANYAQFKGVVYFNSDAINPDFDDCIWRTDTSASSLASFKAMALDPWYAGDAFNDSGPPPPAPPTAAFTSSCAQLVCTFTSTSTDSDGTIDATDWDFADTTTDSGATVQHTFPASGVYHVVLTVTDDTGLTGTVAHDVTVSDAPPPAGPVFRASSSANGTTNLASVVVPASVVSGDRLVLVVTAASATTASTPTGWTLLGTQSDGTPDMRSWVFTRAAAANTAGTTVTSTLGASVKSSRVLVAYSGADVPTAVSTVAGPSTTGHATPGTTPAAGSVVLSYWSDKSDTNSGWTLPASVQSRQASVGTGSGRITAAAADAVAPGGAQAGVSATSSVASAKAIMWSIVLPVAGPPPPNQPPTAAFTSSCTDLVCNLSAASSTDSDGTVVGATWDFGDTTTGTGITTPHTFADYGTYTVTVTVTDDDGAPSAPVTHPVVVSQPVASPITFVAQASASANSTAQRVVVPSGVRAGDAMVLVLSLNTNATVSTPAGITGWRLLGTETNGSMSTRVWTRIATAGNANAAVSVTLSATSKGSFIVAAYRGTSQTEPIAAFDGALETVSRAAHTTPAIGVTSDRSWVLWYWAHEDASTTALVPPADVTVRATGNQTGSGRITTLLADSNGAAGVGTAAGRTATAAASTTNASMWAIVLAPA